VPVAGRAQYLSAEGRREFLRKLAIEAVFYLEGRRRKLYLNKDFRKTLQLRLYTVWIEEARQELLKDIKVGDDEVKADYEEGYKDKARFPFDKVKEEIRMRLLERKLDEAYQAKKDELRAKWKVKANYDLFAQLTPENLKEAANLPSPDATLAEGDDYKYTVGQFLQRLDIAPQEMREKMRHHPNPTKLLDYVIGEDLIYAWAKKEGFDKNIDVDLRKKLIEVGTLSQTTRQEIVGRDIFATPAEAKTYYREHQKDFVRDGQQLPFEQVKDQLVARVTDKKRDEATRSLAQSLMRHRYPVVYFEPNIKKCLQ
jgi:hypothetical protein